MKTRWTTAKRVTGSFLIATLLVTETLYAQASLPSVFSSTGEVHLAQTDSVLSRPDWLDGFPSSAGKIKRIHLGSRPEIVIHIQDAHANEEAQRKIAEILDFFALHNSLRLVNVEGARGHLYSDLYSFFPDAAARRSVADFFLSRGRLSGAEYLSIVKQQKLDLFGIEDEDLYEKNRQAYFAAIHGKEKNEPARARWKQLLAALSSLVFSPEWKPWIEYQRSGDDAIFPYIQFLSEEAEESGISLKAWPGIARLRKIVEEERKMDHARLREEMLSLERIWRKNGEWEKVSGWTREYRSQMRSRSSYYGMLAKEILETGNESGGGPGYGEALRYASVMAELDEVDLDLEDEITGLEEAVVRGAKLSEEALALRRLWKIERVMSRLFDLSLTRSEADFFITNRSDFDSPRLLELVRPLAEKYKYAESLPDLTGIDKSMSRVEEFYAAALKRDSVLTAHSLEAMARSHTRICAVITGGFHSPGLERRLSESGFTYVTITPAIKNMKDQAAEAQIYKEAMRAAPVSPAVKILSRLISEIRAAEPSPRYHLAPRLTILTRAAAIDFLRKPDTAADGFASNTGFFLQQAAIESLLNSPDIEKTRSELRAALKSRFPETDRRLIDSYLLSPLAGARAVNLGGEPAALIIPGEADALAVTRYPARASKSEIARAEQGVRWRADQKMIFPDGSVRRFARLPRAMAEVFEQRTPRSELRSAAGAEKKSGLKWQILKTEQDALDHTRLAYAHSKLKLNKLIRADGIRGPVHIRAHWELPDGRRPVSLESPDNTAVRAYKLMFETSGDRQTYMLRMKGENEIISFTGYSADLRRVDTLFSRIETSSGSKGLQNILEGKLGIKIPDYATLYVERQGSNGFSLHLDRQAPAFSQIEVTSHSGEVEAGSYVSSVGGKNYQVTIRESREPSLDEQIASLFEDAKRDSGFFSDPEKMEELKRLISKKTGEPVEEIERQIFAWQEKKRAAKESKTVLHENPPQAAASAPAAASPNPSRKTEAVIWRIAQIAGALIAGIYFFDISTLGGILYWGAAVLLSVFSMHAGQISQVILNEAGHMSIARLRGFRGVLETSANRTANVPLSEWGKALIPFSSLLPQSFVRVPGARGREDHIIRIGGFTFSFVLAGVLTAAFIYYGGFHSVFFSSFMAGAGFAFVQSLLSDLIYAQPEGIYCCGNYGGGYTPTAYTASGHSSTRPLNQSEFDSLIEKMAEIEVIRGEQADGEVEYLQSGNNIYSVRTRIVKSKRGQLPQAIRAAQSRAVRSRTLQLRMASPGKPVKRPAVILKQGHSRYGTSSGPSVEETQPPTGLGERTVPVWEIENGRYKIVRKPVATYVAHNGDFDYYRIYGKDLSFEDIRDGWAKKINGKRNPARGDTPRLAETFDHVYAYKMWKAAFRFAFTHGVVENETEPVPDVRTTSKWGDKMDDLMNSLASQGRIVPPTDEFSDMPQNIEELKSNILRTLAADMSFQEWVPEEKRGEFVNLAVQAFFTHNLYNTIQFVKKRAKGSFGMIVTSSLEPDVVVAAANLQPLSFGFFPKHNLVVWSSEAAAIKVPFKAGGKNVKIPFRYDMDQETGEIAEFKIRPGKPVRVKIYSELQEREMTAEEVAGSGRAIDMADNPLVESLPHFNTKDLVGQDIAETPAILEKIRRVWNSPRSNNRQTAADFFSFLLERDTYKRLVAAINTRRVPAEIQAEIETTAAELSQRFFRREMTEAVFKQDIETAAADYIVRLDALAGRGAETGDLLTLDEDADLVLTGLEVSQWLGERFAMDLHRMFPALKIETISSNKILTALKFANLKKTGGAFTVPENSHYVRFGKRTRLLAFSQSGQTFPTLNATIAVSRLFPGHVFAHTGGIDTLMGRAVGQVYAKGAPFSRRIFDNLSGLRPAEPSTVAAAATHQTMTELLIYLGAEFKNRFKQRQPLDMIFEPEDFNTMRQFRDDIVNHSAPSIMGYSINGADEPIQSDINKRLIRMAGRWSQHVLEFAIVTVVVAVVVSSLVYFNIPFFPSQFSWFPRPSWFVNLFLASPLPPLGVTALDGILWFIPIGSAYFIAFSYPFTLALRILQRRFPLLQRTGKRTITIGALSYVHQLLEAYVSKLFSLSYGFASVDVHGGNPRDHFLARFGHRIVRGSLLLLLRPDGRLMSKNEDESATNMTKSQAEGVENFRVGAEVFTFGRNPQAKNSTAGENIILPAHATPVRANPDSFYRKAIRAFNLKEDQFLYLKNRVDNMSRLYMGQPLHVVAADIAEGLGLTQADFDKFEVLFLEYGRRQFSLEDFYDTRIDSFEGLLAGFVMFYHLKKKIAAALSFFGLVYNIAASQSRTRVATTRSPRSSPDISALMAQIGHNQPKTEPVTFPAVTLPFEVVTSAPAKRSKEISETQQIPAVPVQSNGHKDEPVVPAPAPPRPSTRVNSLLLQFLELGEDEESSGARSELRKMAGPFVSAAGEAHSMEMQMSGEEKKILELKRRANSAGMDLESMLLDLSDQAALQEALMSTQISDRGILILNYRSSDHSIPLVKQMMQSVNAQPFGIRFYVVKDPATTDAQWELLKRELAVLKNEKERMQFIVPHRETGFEGVVVQQSRRAAHEKLQLLQILESSVKSSEAQRLSRSAMIGAVTIGRGRIIILGAVKPVAHAQTLRLYDLLHTIVTGSQLVGQSA